MLENPASYPDKYPELLKAGMASDWPTGRGVYVSADSGCAVRVGHEDHFSVVVRQQSTVLNEAFDRAYECLGIVTAEIDAQDFAPVKGQDSIALSPCFG
eukprot:6190403-Pyramimonas_sp.AAC.2